MPSKVFISHSSKDRAIVEHLVSALEARGAQCWVAWRDVPSGRAFGDEIAAAIKACRIMILVFSAHANNSDQIKKEVVLAGRYQTDIIPLMIENVVPTGTFEYELSIRQWVDLIGGWEMAVDRLAVRIEELGLRLSAADPRRRLMPVPWLRRPRVMAALAAGFLAVTAAAIVVWRNPPPLTPPGSGKYPQYSARLVSDEENQRLSCTQLRLARNEIFARYGYKFRTADMRQAFDLQSWYHASETDVTNRLTDLEKQNIKALQATEQDRRC